MWESFDATHGLAPYPILAVAGGNANEVFVGYEGVFPDGNAFDDPPEIATSGDVDRLTLRPDGTFDRVHYDISSPPDDEYPDGRDPVRTCYRIVPVLSGPFAGDVWFGCNHGVAMWSARWGRVLEHRHTAINRNGSLYTGDFRGLAVAPNGNVWIGGAHRGGVIHYADEGGNFFAPIDPEIDAFPPGVSKDPNADDWTMAMAVDGAGGVWVAGFGNGLGHMTEGGSWTHLTTADGLPDDRVYDLARDPDGTLWAAAGEGLVRLDGHAIVQTFNNMNGPNGTYMAVGIDAASSPRRVLFGTSRGIGVYDGE